MIGIVTLAFGICLLFTFMGFWQAAIVNILLGIWLFKLDDQRRPTR